MSTIFAIDDLATNLLLIEKFLEDSGYNLKCFLSARAAFKELQSGAEVDAILLDRMMPDMDGMAFMQELQTLDDRRLLPVIMQTAASRPTQIAEGIKAGAYYYLTKPFSADVLKAVLARALEDHAMQRRLKQQTSQIESVTAHITGIDLNFRTLDDVDNISVFLASLYPDPQNALLGIRELMINAVEHGNLAISYDEKSSLLRSGRWREEVDRRLKQTATVAQARLQRSATQIKLTIEDAGAGFHPGKFLDLDPARRADPHGRGIAMSRMISFDSIAYVEPGNKVMCRKAIAA